MDVGGAAIDGHAQELAHDLVGAVHAPATRGRRSSGLLLGDDVDVLAAASRRGWISVRYRRSSARVIAPAVEVITSMRSPVLRCRSSTTRAIVGSSMAATSVLDTRASGTTR